MNARTAIPLLVLFLAGSCVNVAGAAPAASAPQGAPPLSFWHELTDPASPAVQKAQLWRLALRGPQAATTEVSGDVSAASREPRDGAAVFTWKVSVGGRQAEVEMGVSKSAGASLSRWSLLARLPAGWTVARADFMLAPLIRNEAGLKMAVPFGWGLEYDVKPGMGYEGTYPSLVLSSPFVAFYKEGRGLYVGAHDPKGCHKRLVVKAGEAGTSVTWTHWPGDAETANGVYALPSDIMVGAFEGDYRGAARIYRDFVGQAPWGASGSASVRTAPQWLKDVDLWLRSTPDPLQNVELCLRAKEFFGVPIAVHWYQWHQIPYDTLYPEYLPAKEHFKEGVRTLQDAGLHVMPYINGRLCDPKSKTWTEEHADRAAARKEDGGFYTEVYGSKAPLNVMCPATAQWREKIGGIVDRLFNEYGVDGVYIDQIGAAAAMRCYAADHGHSPGGGTFWADGYRRMLKDIRGRMPAGRILTTEENAECWNDQFDALLMVNTPASSDRRIVPLMPALYADRVITFGFQYVTEDDLKRGLPWRAKMAREFIWGAQLGWVRVETIMADGFRREAEFLRNLVRCRRQGHDLLVGGRFLGELNVTGDNPRLKIDGNAPFGGTYSIELLAVLASAWSADGVSGIVAVNMSDEARRVVVDVSSEIAPGPSVKREVFGADGPVAAEISPAGKIEMTIPPREGRLVKLIPAAGDQETRRKMTGA